MCVDACRFIVSLVDRWEGELRNANESGKLSHTKSTSLLKKQDFCRAISLYETTISLYTRKNCDKTVCIMAFILIVRLDA